MTEAVDAVVVGAGHNGLVAAAYLARAGLAVVVLERRELVGGACVTEELWPGVRASPGAYTLSLLRPEIVRELELARHGLSVEVHEPYLFAPSPDGRKVVSWSDPRRTHDQLAADWSSGDADAYLAWSGRRAAAAARARPLMLEPPDRERWRDAIGEELLDGSIAAELAGIPSEPVRVPFAIQGLIGTLAGPSDPGTSFVGLYHDLGCFAADVDADAAADAAIARFAESCPELPDRIVDRLALGPRQLERRFGITGGHIFHGEMLPAQLLERRPGARRFGGLDALYLCGSGAHPGGAVTGAPGLLAARAALEDLAPAAAG